MCGGKLRPFFLPVMSQFATGIWRSIWRSIRCLQVNLEVNSLFGGQAFWMLSVKASCSDPWISLFEATIHEHTQPKYTEGSSIFQFWCDFDGSMPRPRNDPLKEVRRTYSPNLQANSLFGGQFGGQFPVQEANLWLQANCRASA